jgi:hypothetical protein
MTYLAQGEIKGMTLIVPADWSPRTPEGENIFPAVSIGARRANKREDGPVARVISVGKGHIVEAQEASYKSSIAAMAAIIREPADHDIPPLSKAAAIDGQLDELYVTVTTEDLLLYNHGDQPGTMKTPQGEIEVPAHTIISLPRADSSPPPKAPH